MKKVIILTFLKINIDLGVVAFGATVSIYNRGI